MRKIRIAQIGVNQYSHGPEMFTNLTELPDIFEVVGYASLRTKEKDVPTSCTFLRAIPSSRLMRYSTIRR